MVKTWAEKEMRNLKRLQAAGIRCPHPCLLKQHVLIMDFLGNDGYDFFGRDGCLCLIAYVFVVDVHKHVQCMASIFVQHIVALIYLYWYISWCAPRLKDKALTSVELLESYRVVCMDMRR